MNRQLHTSLTQSYKKKYESARYSLLIMVIFTLVNCALLLFGSNTYFLFSAPLVYYFLWGMMYLTGKLPPEAYAPEDVFEFYPEGLYIVAIVFAVVAISVYFLCWFKSKNMHHKWLIASLVLFCIDVVVNFLWLGFIVDNIIDYVFAAYVIYSITAGIVAYTKLAKLPEPIEEPAPAAEDDFGFAERDFSYNDGNTDSTEQKEEENK